MPRDMARLTPSPIRALLLAAAMLATPVHAQEQAPAAPAAAPPAPAQQLPRAAPIGGDLFAVVGIPKESCLLNAPPLGAPMPANVIDGSKMSVGRIERLRRRQKTGTLHVRNANFSGRDLSDAKFSNICFYNSNLSRTKWDGAKLSGIGFIDTDLSNSTLLNAQIPYSLFRDVRLENVNASGSNISQSRLDGGWKGSMKNLKLDNTQLVGFRVECGVTETDGCPMERTGLSLRGANLTKASFYPFYFPDVDATGTVLDDTEVGLEHLLRFRGSRIAGPIIVRSPHYSAVFLPHELQRLALAFAGRSAGAAAAAPTDGDDSASFDCASARTVVQRVICTTPDSEIRRMDRDVARLSRALAETDPAAPGEQARWVRERRDTCALEPENEIVACLKNAYTARRKALIPREAPAPAWTMQPNSYALFVTSDAPLTKEFLQSELFLRIRPVILEAAQSRMMLHVLPNGTIEAKGGAMGNCALSAAGLNYDARTGWINEGGMARTRRRAAVAGVPIMKVSGSSLEVAEIGENGQIAGSSVARCRMGTFVTMQRVDVPQSDLARLWAVFR